MARPTISLTSIILTAAWASLIVLIVVPHVRVGSAAGIAALLVGGLAFFVLVGAMATGAIGPPNLRGRVVPHDHPLTPHLALDEVLDVRQQRRSGGVVVIEGRLRTDPELATHTLTAQLRDTEWTPLLQEGDLGEHRVMLVRGPVSRPARASGGTRLPLLLAALTLMTTTWAGALHQGVNLLTEPARFAVGLPYALGLMLILGAHELGHYLTARRYGMTVTLPYFIPVPFALGTFGAFIQLKSPSPSRRALFDVALAGPLAGLVFAVPALLIGLPLSQVVPSATVTSMLHSGADVGSSILLAVLAKLSIGPALTDGHVLVLHPLAFAGWLGLVVTALNLLPIGQLDGGHVADAMFGQRTGAAIGTVAMVALFALGLFVWSGLLFWAFLVFFIAGSKGLPPLNDLSVIDGRRFALGTASFVLLAAILVPIPHALFSSLGIRCPYL